MEASFMRNVHLTLLVVALAVTGCSTTSPCGTCDESANGSGSSSSANGSGSCCTSDPSKPGPSGTDQTPTGPNGTDETAVEDNPPVTTALPAGFIFSPYKDVGISLNWNTNVISSAVSGTMTELAPTLAAKGAKAVTLAFATGECGAENWAGLAGETLASVNVSRLVSAGIDYVVSTGGAAGSFTCGSDAGFATFLDRWDSPRLRGVDFDIEAGQSTKVLADLAQRIKAAHTTHPSLRFSLTLATLAANAGSSTAMSLGGSAPNSLNATGAAAIAAVRQALGVADTEAAWPSYVTVNLMTMDYGSTNASNCVVASGKCDMGQSAIQAAHNLHDSLHIPYSAIELTPMLGMNDATDEHFRLEDVDTIVQFASDSGLAGIHYWSFDRDRDCADQYASSTCSSMGNGYASTLGYLARFTAAGL